MSSARPAFAQKSYPMYKVKIKVVEVMPYILRRTGKSNFH